LAEAKLSPEERERRAIQRAKDDAIDKHTIWMQNLIKKTLDEPIKVSLLSKIIDLSAIDGESLSYKHGLLPDLYNLFFVWPKGLNPVQQRALEEKEKKPVIQKDTSSINEKISKHDSVKSSKNDKKAVGFADQNDNEPFSPMLSDEGEAIPIGRHRTT